ncbi:hypothetical protein A1O1_03047, partial [Capronia coronata CBS 617.96]
TLTRGPHSGLCQRRRWPEPAYQTSCSPAGYRCVVRVNNREYQTSNYHPSESSAKEGAALIAFNICRNFSANDGFFPAGFAHGGVIQGNPVPVGSGRHNRRSGTTTRADYRGGDTDSSGSRSGGSSPDWNDLRHPGRPQISTSRRDIYPSDANHHGRRGLSQY